MKIILYVVGIVLVLIGVLGFVNDPVLGIFELSVLHSAINLVAGLVLLWGGFKGGEVGRLGPKVIGIIYALVAVLGLVPLLAALNTNLAGTVLQVVVAVALLYAGFKMKEAASSTAPKQPQMSGSSSGNTPPQTPPTSGQGGPTPPTGGQQ